MPPRRRKVAVDVRRGIIDVDAGITRVTGGAASDPDAIARVTGGAASDPDAIASVPAVVTRVDALPLSADGACVIVL